MLTAKWLLYIEISFCSTHNVRNILNFGYKYATYTLGSGTSQSTQLLEIEKRSNKNHKKRANITIINIKTCILQSTMCTWRYKHIRRPATKKKIFWPRNVSLSPQTQCVKLFQAQWPPRTNFLYEHHPHLFKNCWTNQLCRSPFQISWINAFLEVNELYWKYRFTMTCPMGINEPFKASTVSARTYSCC